MARPSFYKFLTDGFRSHSQIPGDFMKHFHGVVPQKCTIWSSCGGSWDVEMVTVNINNLFFGKGWEILVKDHSLEEGDFLIFKYRGTSTFDVKVYGKNRCEKVVPNKLDVDSGNGIGTPKAKSNLHLQPSVQRDLDDDTVNGVGTKNVISNPIMKPSVYVIEVSDDDDDDDDTTCIGVPPKKKAKYSAADEDAGNIIRKLEFDSPSTDDVGIVNNPTFKVVMKPFNLGGRAAYVTVPQKLYIHGKDKDFTLIVDQSTRSWPIKYRASSHKLGCGWPNFAKDNHLVVNDICVFEMVGRTMKVQIKRRK